MKNTLLKLSKNYKISYLVFFIFILISLHAFNKVHLSNPAIKIALISNHDAFIQAFCDQGVGFREELSSSFRVNGEFKRAKEFSLTIPNDCSRIRLDFGEQDSNIHLVTASIMTGNGFHKDLLNDIIGGIKNQIELKNNNGLIDLISLGADPYIILNGEYVNLTSNHSLFSIRNIVIFIFIFIFINLIINLMEFKSIYGLIILAITLRLISYIFNPLPLSSDTLIKYWPDENSYYTYSMNFLRMGISYFDTPSSLEVAPGNIFYLSFLLNIFNGDIGAIRFFNLIFLSSIITISVYKIGEELFSKAIGFYAALLVAIYYPLIAFAPTILTEYIFTSSLLLYLWLIVVIHKSSEKSTPFYLLLITSFLGVFATLTRTVFFPIIIITIIYAFYLRYVGNRFLSKKFFIIGFLICFGLAPFFINAYKQSGNFMISTGSGAALWLGSRVDTDGDEPVYRKKSYDTNIVAPNNTHISLEGDKLLRNAALINISNSFYDYIINCVKRIGRLIVGNNFFWFFPFDSYFKWSHSSTFIDSCIKIGSILVATFVAVFGLSYLLILKSIRGVHLFVFSKNFFKKSTIISCLINISAS